MFIARLRSYDYYHFYDNIIIKNREYNIEKYRKKEYRPSNMIPKLEEIYISGNEFWDFNRYVRNNGIAVPVSCNDYLIDAFTNQCSGCGEACCRGLIWQGTRAYVVYEMWYEMCGWGTKSKQQSQSTQQKRNIMV